MPLVLDVPASIPAHSEEHFGVQTRFPQCICRDDIRKVCRPSGGPFKQPWTGKSTLTGE